MTVVEQNRDLLVQPSRAHEQVERVVAVHIARDDLQTADRGGNSETLRGAGSQPETNRVSRTVSGTAVLGFDTGEIRLVVSIKISDSNMRIQSCCCIGRRDRGNGRHANGQRKDKDGERSD